MPCLTSLHLSTADTTDLKHQQLHADGWDLGGGDFCWNFYCSPIGIPALYFTMRKGVLIDWEALREQGRRYLALC